MSSSYSNSLRIELIGPGDQAGAWGNTTNSNLSYILDTAIAGYQTVNTVSTNTALTYLDGASEFTTENQSIYATLRFTTSTGAAFNVYAPPVPKQYIIFNNSGHSMTIYNSTNFGDFNAAGAGVTILDGKKVVVFSDGDNFYTIDAANLTGTLEIANGGTGQTTQQAALNALAGTQINNRVLRSDGTNTTLSQVVLTTDVAGVLPVGNGGTGVSTSTGTGSTVLSNSPSLATPRVLGSSSGYTTIASANTGATNFTATLPTENFTVGFRNVPPVGTKTSSYTLAINDVGKYVQVSTGGSIVIPNGVFSEGDAITLFNNTSGTITITCSALTTYLAGLNTPKTSLTLSIRGVATILFISGNVCVVSGLVA
jgi:hypothetical protein